MPMTMSKFVVDRNKQLPDDRISKIKSFAHNMFKGLSVLHAKGVAHRDIKPENILIDPETSTSKICDFGSAKQLGNHNYGFKTQEAKCVTGSVTYISTRYYRAPELLYGNPYYGTEIDLWAAGCVLAELFSHKHDHVEELPEVVSGASFVLFRGQSNAHQLALIINAKGSPTT
jgi:serine/threonine protein kinase